MTENTGINVKYIYSACIVTSTDDVTILHDPWFTEGVYDGAWYQFPKIDDPIKSIGEVDYIYVSHIHPDHYDPIFIEKYFSVYGEKPIIIADHKPNCLAGKMKADGFLPTVLKNKLTIGKTDISIIPHQTGSISDVDSAIIIKFHANERTHCIVNANDIIFDEEMRVSLKNRAGGIDVLLCGYTGAGPYPQTYFDIDDEKLADAAIQKKHAFFERYKLLVGHMNSKVNIPFAGQYILGGRLSHLNHFRGVADPVEILSFDDRAIVLTDAGGEINTLDLIPSSQRTKAYPLHEIDKRISEIRSNRMDYERLIDKDEIFQLPLIRLLQKATRNAVEKSECDIDYYFCFQIDTHSTGIINANSNKDGEFRVLHPDDVVMKPRTEISIDPRYLFGLLTNVYHWNNAEVGSQFLSKRYPNEFNLSAQLFLNFLAV